MFRLILLLVFIFLPVIESYDRILALNFLLIISLILSFVIFRRKRLHIDTPVILFSLFLLLSLITLPLSLSSGRSFTELTRYLAYFLIFISLRDSNNQDVSLLYKRSVIVTSLILSFLFVLYSFFPGKLPLLESGMNLIFPYFGHNRLVDILILSLPLIIFQYLKEQKNKIFWLSLFLFELIILFFTYGRGGMIALSLSLLIYIWLEGGNRANLRKIILTIGFLSCLFILSSFIYSNFHLTGKFQGRPQGLFKPLILESRFDYYRQALRGFARFPVFGSGLDTFRYVSKLYQEKPLNWSWYVHNHYLQIFQETGGVGGSLFLLLILTLIIRAFRQVKTTGVKSNWPIVIGLTASSFHVLIDYDWQFVSVFLFIWLAFAILVPPKFSAPVVKVRPFLFTISLLFLYQMLFVSSPDKRAAEIVADNSIAEDIKVKLLIKFYNDDPYNDNLSQNIAQNYLAMGNPEKAHLWNRRSAYLNPLDSEGLIKKDFGLYLNQAQKALEEGKTKKAIALIILSKKLYPVFFDFYKTEIPAEPGRLKELIALLNNNSAKIGFSVNEIKQMLNVDTVQSY